MVKDTITKVGSTDTTVNEYSYDAYGNLQTVKTTKNGQTTVQQYSYGNTWSDELISFEGRVITYDILGKPTEYYNGMVFSWAAGKLATIQRGDDYASYRYDYKGLREEKTVNGKTTRYLYEGHDLIAELSEDQVYFIYDGYFNLVGFEWNGTAYYYQYDFLGDVIGIVNTEGETLCTYSYDLWGAITGITGDQALAERNPIRYRGYYFDNETGFYYLETRYYDPQVKRFLSYDDIESFFYGDEEDMESLFVYCGNNPVLLSDHSGQASCLNEVWTIDEFRVESERIKRELNTYLLGKGNSVNTSVNSMPNVQTFVSEWNSMSNRTVVVINTHGSYDTIKTDGGRIGIRDVLGLEGLPGLQRKTITLLWILACSCGHYDSSDNNIARAFARKTTGLVVASDGIVDRTVLSYLGGSIAFKVYTGSIGWVTYKSSNYGSSVYVYKLGKKKLSLKEVLQLVQL